MFTRLLNETLRHAGYEIRRTGSTPRNISPGVTAPLAAPSNPPPLDPVWPLPRKPGGPSDEDIRKEFARHDLWHYAYEFEGNLAFPTRHNNPGPVVDAPRRPLQRFGHFMPYLAQAQNGSLRGKRVLDIACNSGFWSIQCALLGAHVVGFDGRPELIEQANLIRSIVGVNTVQFTVLDFWDMSPETLGGTFDIVLNLGILYHLPKPLAALERTVLMANDHVLLDTEVYPSHDSLIKLRWEDPDDIRRATRSGLIAYPSRSSIEMMLKHIGVSEYCQIPIRTVDMPSDYLEHKRASWLITV